MSSRSHSLTQKAGGIMSIERRCKENKEKNRKGFVREIMQIYFDQTYKIFDIHSPFLKEDKTLYILQMKTTI